MFLVKDYFLLLSVQGWYVEYISVAGIAGKRWLTSSRELSWKTRNFLRLFSATGRFK